MIEQECLDVLQKQGVATLIQWSHALNRWEWPRELPLPEEPRYIPNGRRGQIIQWIESKVGRRAILREHNQKMTDEEFDDFYRGCFLGDVAARKRYDIASFNKIYREMGIIPEFVDKIT